MPIIVGSDYSWSVKRRILWPVLSLKKILRGRRIGKNQIIIRPCCGSKSGTHSSYLGSIVGQRNSGIGELGAQKDLERKHSQVKKVFQCIGMSAPSTNSLISVLLCIHVWAAELKASKSIHVLGSTVCIDTVLGQNFKMNKWLVWGTLIGSDTCKVVVSFNR